MCDNDNKIKEDCQFMYNQFNCYKILDETLNACKSRLCIFNWLAR